MIDFLKKKSAASFVYAGISIFTLITTIVYILFASNYGMRSTAVMLALFGAIIAAAILFIFDTAADSYLEVIVSALIGLGLTLFAVSCVGDYADAVSQIVMFGSGAPIGGIIALDIALFVSLLAAFVGAGLRKGELEKADTREPALKAKKGKAIIAVVSAVCVIAIIIAVSSLLPGKQSFFIETAQAEHGSYVIEIKDKGVDSAAEGEVVSVVVTPDDGFTFNSINVRDEKDEIVTFKSGSNQYSFTMPASSVSVTVTFGYKPTEYAPDNSVAAQAGFSTASLLTYADGTFEYTFVTAGQAYGATQTKTSYYAGTWAMSGNTIVLTAAMENYTYSFSHPRTDVAKLAYDQFCTEHSSEITEKFEAGNTAYIRSSASRTVLTFTLDESAMTFGISSAG